MSQQNRSKRGQKSLLIRAIEVLIILVFLFMFVQAVLFAGNLWEREMRAHDAAIEEFRETGFWPDEY